MMQALISKELVLTIWKSSTGLVVTAHGLYRVAAAARLQLHANAYALRTFDAVFRCCISGPSRTHRVLIVALAGRSLDAAERT